ncbi:MAG: hypothetical protein M0R66_01320 [Candidatus Omnitrophica bacterium]|nr:hypothetical protein [Candidatus Omnitrophota bacterium]
MQDVLRMLRHYLEYNVADPLSEASRGRSVCTQYFSGDNSSGQVNYLGRRPATGSTPIVSVNSVVKTSAVDYVYSSSAGTITWAGYTPPSGSDNIMVQLNSITPWVYDDNLREDTIKFPRIAIMDVGAEHEDAGQGQYRDYDAGPGQMIVRRVKIVVRDRRNTHAKTFTYQSKHVLDYELVQAIAENVKEYLNTHEVPPLWKFWRWKIVRGERVYSEEDVDGIIRHDLTVDVTYFDRASGT